MRFEALLGRQRRGELGQVEAAEMLGVSVRTLQRWVDRFEEAGADGLSDRRLGRRSPRRAPVEELERMLGLFRDKYWDFTVKHFHEQLVKRHNYVLGYTVTKLALHAAGLVRPAAKRSAHRKKRPRRPLRGMLLHQDGSRHAWLEGQPALDLIVTMDDATSDLLSMFLVGEEGTASSFRGLREVIGEHGLFVALYTDRGSHYFETPQAGGKVSKTQLTQVGRALKQLGIEHIAAYSPQARGRSERLFRTLQDRLPKELRLAGIDTIDAANAWFKAHYIAEHNRLFAIAPEEDGTAFVPDREGAWRDILCVIEERVVGNDNTLAWAGRRLQLPPNRLRPHFVRAKVQVREYPDGSLAVDLGPHRLARYGADGSEVPAATSVASCSKRSRDGLDGEEQEGGPAHRPPLTASARAASELPCRKGLKGTSKGRALEHQAGRQRAA
jgi:transposase